MAEVEVKSTSGDVKVITNNAVVSDSLIEQGSGKLSLQQKDPNRVSGTGALGERSVAFGYNTKASGKNSHAENYNSVASGINAHAEGRETTASGVKSHAEGERSVAKSLNSHAEGRETVASGSNSHAEGYNTRAMNDSEHACGRFNKSNHLAGKTETIFSIGIGSSDTARKNAVEVLKDGRVLVYGVGGYNGTNPFESGNILSVISALGERIDALNEHVTALEARIAALEGA